MSSINTKIALKVSRKSSIPFCIFITHFTRNIFRKSAVPSDLEVTPVVAVVEVPAMEAVAVVVVAVAAAT